MNRKLAESVRVEVMRLVRERDADFGPTEVALDLGGPMSLTASDTKLDRYAATFHQHGFCRWAVESRDGDFLGHAGVMPSPPANPLGALVEIGWRRAEGLGPWVRHWYATEAARAALQDASCGLA